MDDTLDRAEAEGARAALSNKGRGTNPYLPIRTREDEDHAFMWDVGWLEREHSEALARHLPSGVTRPHG